MIIRKFLTASAIVAASTLAFSGAATADSIWHPTKTEAGFEFKPDHAKSTKTRAEVQKEAKLARDFGKGQVSPDGWRYVGGERGWVLEGHKIDYLDGKWVHTDGIDKTSAKPSPKMTPSEQAQFDATYGKSGS